MVRRAGRDRWEIEDRELFILSGTSPLSVCDSTHPDCRPVALFKTKLRLLAIGGRPLQLALLGVFVKSILAAGHPHFCILYFRRLLHFYCLEHHTLRRLLPFVCLIWFPYFWVFWQLRDVAEAQTVKKALATLLLGGRSAL